MTPLRRRIALCVALVLATGGLMVNSPTSVVRAADPAWVHPISPAACTPEQRAAGDVSTCVIPLLSGMPEDRGWPKPPFPTPTAVTVLPWVDLGINASDHVTVAKVQAALNSRSEEHTSELQSLTNRMPSSA